MKHYLLIFPLILIVHFSYGQSVLDTKIDYNFNEVKYEDALNLLIKKSALNIVFSSDILPTEKQFNLNSKGKTAKFVLDNFIKNQSLSYKTTGDLIILFYQKPPQRKYQLSGYIQDKTTGERLLASSISILQTTKGTTSNNYGFYSIQLPDEEVVIDISYLGYESKQIKVNLSKDQFLNVELDPSITLPEIIVIPEQISKSKLPVAIKETNISTTTISAQNLSTLPTFVGETDLLRAALLLPGVTSAPDGIGGIHVRGGNSDQNLILLDGAPIYNPFHTAGLFSIFNSNVVSNATLLKGAFPARYGGRISSVLDVRTKEGNNKKITGEVGIGLVSGKATLEGPFAKGKGSFIVSGRRTFIDRIIEDQTRKIKLRDTLNNLRPREGFSGYNFYDLNLKANYNFSDKDKVYISYYQGSDSFHDEERQVLNDTLNEVFLFDSLSQSLNWGNELTSFRWNHLFNNRLFFNMTLTFSSFEFESSLLNAGRQEGTINDFEQTDLTQFSSTITDYGLRLDYDYILSDKHYLRFGGAYTNHTFIPGVGGVSVQSILPDSTGIEFENNLDSLKSNSTVRANDFSAYFEDDFSITSNFKVNLGAHFTYFEVQGQPYISLQPRLAAFYQASDQLQFKGSFGRMRQHLHVLSNSNIGLPNDLWVPATKNIKPQDAWQGVLGFDYQFKNRFGLSVEGYYKRMKNLISYQEGASFLFEVGDSQTGTIDGRNWETKVTSGNGTAYGVELLLEKKIGKTTGWMSYVYAHSTRQFDEINNGESFAYRYDRRHNFKTTIAHYFAPWLQGNFNWVISTGIATTLPQSVFEFNIPGNSGGGQVIDFGPKNSTRLPTFHRFDAGLNFFLKSGRFKHIINIGAYNIYNRRNPLYITFRERFVADETFVKREFVEVSLIQFLPSFSYTFKF